MQAINGNKQVNKTMSNTLLHNDIIPFAKLWG